MYISRRPRMKRLVVHVFIVIIFTTGIVQAQCPASNPCQCDFGEETVFKSKSEVLAAAVGALSPLLAAGGGFGIWKLIQSKMTDTGGDFSRESSDLSNRSARKSGSISPATNSTRTVDSRQSRTTPLSLNDMDFDDDHDFPKSPSPSDYYGRSDRSPLSSSSRAPVAANPNEPNSWMF